MKTAIFLVIISTLLYSTTTLAYRNHSSSRTVTTRNGDTYSRNVQTNNTSNSYNRNATLTNDTTGNTVHQSSTDINKNN